MTNERKDMLTASGVGLGAGALGGLGTYGAVTGMSRKSLANKLNKVKQNAKSAKAEYGKASDKAYKIKKAIGDVENDIVGKPADTRNAIRKALEEQHDVSNKHLANTYGKYSKAVEDKNKFKSGFSSALKKIPKKAAIASLIAGTAIGGATLAGAAKHFKNIREEM